MAAYRHYRLFGIFFFMMAGGSFLFAQNQRAVLLRGNSWITEDNLFAPGISTALFGEYSVESLAAEDESAQGIFLVRVSTDPLLASGDQWQPRPGAAGRLQRQEGRDFFITFSFALDAASESWTVLFQFPRPDEFADGAINLLIDVWTSRFRYFLSSARAASDMSLPAVFNF